MQYLVEVRTHRLGYDRLGKPYGKQNGDLGDW